jgi:hypothetical protein
MVIAVSSALFLVPVVLLYWLGYRYGTSPTVTLRGALWQALLWTTGTCWSVVVAGAAHGAGFGLAPSLVTLVAVVLSPPHYGWSAFPPLWLTPPVAFISFMAGSAYATRTR